MLKANEGRTLLIVNYAFDTTDRNNISLVLRLNAPLPNNISILSDISIEQEIITTHTENIWYRNEGYIEATAGLGLGSDIFGGLDQDLNINDQEQDIFETYADLTGSLGDTSIEQTLFSGSNDINLDIDYNDFSNHTFFGSAVSKLENFKTKVSIIEGYYTEISKSLSGNGISIDGDNIVKIDRRKDNFNKIQNVIDEFTPYERFLYFDQQSETTSSAPGIGHNLSKFIPVSKNGNFSKLNTYDGFNIVYNHTGSGTDTSINYFIDTYKAEEKPFFNYSGSVYLSFLLKGDHRITGFAFDNINDTYNQTEFKNKIPNKALGSGSILSPNVTGSRWNRYIFEASQSYWRPLENKKLTHDGFDFSLSGSGIWYEILSSSEQINSASNSPTGSVSSYLITPVGDFYKFIGSATTGNASFSGSFMPSGELFRIKGVLAADGASNAATSSYITDIKLTKNNPTGVLPFSFLYSTGSTNWESWYNGLHESASVYDEQNIHSLTNNLPKLIKNDPESGDLKTFINMLADQYDLTKNYIDNYSQFHKRQYTTIESPPTNAMPILARHAGWDLSQPFTSSLHQYYGVTEYDNIAGKQTVKQQTHNTWKKVLNNLIYMYKTKGTAESIRAMLNVYGYLPEAFPLKELGASAEEHNPSIITNDISALLEGLKGSADNVSFIQQKDEFYSYVFNNNIDRILNFDWETNSAAGLNTLEFILKPHSTTNDQVILESSGSGTEKFWDLALIASSSGDNKGKLEFRLNNTETGSGVISNNAISMSTSYLPLKTSGDLWNVMIQRMTGSISGTGTQEYRMFAGLQSEDKIKYFNVISMSVSGGISADSNYYANQNWSSTGSLSTTVSGNLYVGRTYTGSLAEFRTWTTTLSASKFKQHILNKKSTTGNNIDAYFDEIKYRYRLQENWGSGSTNPKIIDANPNKGKDYSININSDLLTGSVLYDKDDIDVVKFSIRTGGTNQQDDNKIIINPSEPVIANLNASDNSVKTIYERGSQRKRRNIASIQIVRSPQTLLNDFIIDAIADFDITSKIADPDELYEYEYKTLNTFRDTLFNNFDVSVDINKWIRAQANIFNRTLIDAVENILPARIKTESPNLGVIFEPTLLERDKIKNPTALIQTGSDIGQLESNDLNLNYINFNNSKVKSETINVPSITVSDDIVKNISYEKEKNAKYSVTDFILVEGSRTPKLGEISVPDNIDKDITYEKETFGEYDVTSNIAKTFSVVTVPTG